MHALITYELFFHSLPLAIFMDNTNAAVFIGCSISIPLMFLAGIFMPLKDLHWTFQNMSMLSMFRFAVRMFLLSIYGFGRCQADHVVFAATHNVSMATQPRWVGTVLMIQKQMRATREIVGDDLYDADYLDDSDDGATYLNVELSADRRFNEMFIGEDNVKHPDYPRPYLLIALGIGNDVFWWECAGLVIHIVVYRILAYCVLLSKIKRKG